jgi:hypothetical protein
VYRVVVVTEEASEGGGVFGRHRLMSVWRTLPTHLGNGVIYLPPMSDDSTRVMMRVSVSPGGYGKGVSRC